MPEKPNFYVVNFSGGKDSTAMLLRLIEEHRPIDAILYCDTGLDFPEMYEHIDRVEQAIGREITRVRSDEPFEYIMFDRPIQSMKERFCHNGYGWPGHNFRWCTYELKTVPIKRFEKQYKENYTVMHYVGLAADEGYRMDRKTNRDPHHIHPLIEWSMTEKDCLKYCYDHGYAWGGLYQHYTRLSCWCCPYQTLDELRALRQYHTELWEKLKTWDKRNNAMGRTFRREATVPQLEARFDFELEWLDRGEKLRTRAFYNALKERLASLK